jgi:hypothetical protein
MADRVRQLVKIGETPTVRFTLKDTDPATGNLVPFDLTGWVVTMTVARGSTVVIDEATCLVDSDQTANKGKGSCRFNATAVEYPNLRKGTYDMEFKGIDPLGNAHYFPKRGSVIYGVMEFAEPLS